MRIAILLVLLQLGSLYRYAHRSEECDLSSVRTVVEPRYVNYGLHLWKSSFRYCGYDREIRYHDRAILGSYEYPKRLTVYRSIFGHSERNLGSAIQLIGEWILFSALALGYTMYNDGVLKFAIQSFKLGIDRALGVN